MKRIAALALLSAGLLVPAVLTGTASPASADVEAVSLPTAVTIEAGTLTFTGTVRVDASVTGLRSASLWFRYPDSRTRVLVGAASSREPGVLTVTGRLETQRISPGLNRLQVLDDVDGRGRSILIDLRRRSRVAITRTDVLPDGRVSLAVRVRHYDTQTGKFAASRLSPVQVQERVAGKWVTLATVTSDRAGLGHTVLTATQGTHRYRAVRPAGVTVTSATSKSVTAVR
jgi:hypothetical protein